MNEDATDAICRVVKALGRWEREGTEEARAEHEAACAEMVRALANPDTATPRAKQHHLRLVWSRPE